MDIITPPRTVKGKPTTDSRGPFFFTVDTTHEEFLQLVANCGVAANYALTISSINQSQLTWKQSVPASDKKKPLSSLDGYQAMITKLQVLLKKGKDTTIVLSTPPLARVANNVHFTHVLLPPCVLVDALCQPDDVAAGFGGVGREVEEFQEGPIGSAIQEQKVHLFNPFSKPSHMHTMYTGIPEPCQCPYN
jgi:hypothetical protein